MYDGGDGGNIGQRTCRAPCRPSGQWASRLPGERMDSGERPVESILVFPCAGFTSSTVRSPPSIAKAAVLNRVNGNNPIRPWLATLKTVPFDDCLRLLETPKRAIRRGRKADRAVAVFRPDPPATLPQQRQGTGQSEDRMPRQLLKNSADVPI